MFKSLIAGGRFDKSAGEIKLIDPPLRFADIFYPVAKDHIVTWSTGPSSFVVVGLLEATDFSSKAELSAALLAQKAALKKAATEETPEQKEKRESAVDTSSAGQTKAKKSKANAKSKGDSKAPVGNRGTKLLLEKLSGSQV